MPSSVLILGARGRFGMAAAQAFRQAGWHVLGQMRPGATPPIDAPSEPLAETAQAAIEWLGLDLYDTGALARASRGVSVVVHALNPGAYTDRKSVV